MELNYTEDRRGYLKTLMAGILAAPVANRAVGSARASNPREELKQGIRDRLIQMYEDDVEYDCANAYITAAAHAADDNNLPLTFRFWNASDGGWEYHSLSDYPSAEDFAEKMRNSMRAVTLLDNTTPQEWDDMEAGDLVVYDRRDEGADHYSGHTRGVVGRDCNMFDIVQGTLPPVLSREDMSKEKLKTDMGGPEEDKGRELDWNIVFQNGNSGWDTDGGIGDDCDEDDEDDQDDGSDDDDWWDDDDGNDDDWNDDDGNDDTDDGGDDDNEWTIPGFTLPAVIAALGAGAGLKRLFGEDDAE